MPIEKHGSRTSVSDTERRLRSRAVRLLTKAPLLHASLIERWRCCGRPSCHCARPDSSGHQQLYLYRTVEGKLRQQYVPRSLHEEVRRWVANDHELKGLLEQIWALAWQRVAAATGRKRAKRARPKGGARKKKRSSGD